MEKSNFSKKIRKVAGIVGLSALSLLPGEKSSEPRVSEGLYQKEKIEKVEWEREDLKSKENFESMVFSLAKKEYMNESQQQAIIDQILFIDEALEDAFGELDYRELHNGNSSENRLFVGYSNQKILDNIEDWKKIRKDDVDELTRIKNENFLKEKEGIPRAEIEKEVDKIKKQIFYYDIGRQWVLDNIKNPKYAELFAQEKKESHPNLSAEEVTPLVKTFLQDRIRQASDKNFALSKDIKKSYAKDGSDATFPVGAFYNPENNKAYFPIDQDSLTAINYAIHEYMHKITRANSLISEKAIILFGEAFDSSSVAANLHLLNQTPDECVAYYSDPTEMNARKKQFEYDLERLEIRKYGEKFTKRHYLKVLELQKELAPSPSESEAIDDEEYIKRFQQWRERKFGSGSVEFIQSVKPSMMEKVMNEIADADVDQEKVKNIV